MTASTQRAQVHRPVVMGSHGMVVSGHPLASQAGLRILLEGGNAFDAAVATAATLNVVEPYMSGLAGLGVLLCYPAREKRVRVLNFSGRAPYAATPDRYNPETQERGILASLVPGNVAGWFTLLETYGTMERARVLAPAITYAEEGVPITHQNHHFMQQNMPLLSSCPTAAQIFLPGGNAPQPGTVLRQTALAKSLRAIVEAGQEVFYRGELAERMVRDIEAQGGLMTRQDLADYRAEWEEPLMTTYRGYEVYVPPPNSSGFQMLATLNMLEQCDLPALGYGSPQYLHFLMEAMKLSITDRIMYAGDPSYTAIPLPGLLSKAYAEAQLNRIDWRRAAFVVGERASTVQKVNALRAGIPQAYTDGLTTHLTTADKEGNVVTISQTLGNAFGCGIAVEDTGILLNNMALWFDIDPSGDSPNLIAPGKRVDFCVAPMQVLHHGAFRLSLGTPGSYGILQTTVQMLVSLVDFGMNIQEAIEAPRFRYFEDRRVELEDRFPAATRHALQELGHQIESIGDWSVSVGGGQGILCEPESGVLQGGADPRRDGYAVGF